MESTYIGIAAIKARARESIKLALVETGDLFKAEVDTSEPMLTGAMESSTHITPVSGGGTSWWRKLTVFKYYAVWQHEKTWFHHDQGRAHFVRDPLIVASARLRIALARAAMRLL